MSPNEDDKDKWVDDLLAQLPVAKPIPEDISRQLDQFLVEHISTLETESQSNNVVSIQSHRERRFASRYQLLVAAAAVVGVLTFVGIQTSIFQSNSKSSGIAAKPKESASTTPAEIVPSDGGTSVDSTESAEPKSTPTPVPTVQKTNPSSKDSGAKLNPEVTSPDIQVLGSQGGTEYLPSDAPNVQITKTGMDYAKNLDTILNQIAPYGEPGKLNKLSNQLLECVIKFKLVDRVVAVDSGKYNATNVVTFFAIADDGTTKAFITRPGNTCDLIKKVSINQFSHCLEMMQKE